MINLLKKLYRDAEVHLYTVEAFYLNPILELKDNYELLLRSVGEAYIICQKLKSHIDKIEKIKGYCLSEINGTFYADYEKQWENDPEIQPNYNSETPYEYILNQWGNHPTPEIDLSIVAFVEVSAEFGIKFSASLMNFWPEAGPYKQNAKGEMEKVTMLDCQIDENTKAGSLLADIEYYNERLAKIKDIATNKGSLGEILKLIHSSR
jgi:hypothetical protein